MNEKERRVLRLNVSNLFRWSPEAQRRAEFKAKQLENLARQIKRGKLPADFNPTREPEPSAHWGSETCFIKRAQSIARSVNVTLNRIAFESKELEHDDLS